MKKVRLLICTVVLGLFATSALAGVSGTYNRTKDGSKGAEVISTAKVWMCGGNLCAKVTSGKKKGFNMFKKGIPKTGKGVWKGGMNHPKMGSMNFNGTVKSLGGSKISVKGCMIGGMFCDSEVWVKM